MKKYLILIGIISLAIITACAQQPQPAQPTAPVPAPKEIVVETKEPFITVDEQKVENDVVNIARLYLDKSGYVVIHKVADGKPGAVIGNSEIIREGTYTNVGVKISEYENENDLIAMLHYDDGDNTYEFPGDDSPTTVDGKVVLQNFPLLETQPSQEPVQIEAPAETTEAPTPEVVEIDMIAKQWVFNPVIITVKKGDKVKLNIKSIDVTHGFVIPDFGVNQRLTPGTEVTVEFTADKSGEFTFFCNIFCGSGHGGMRGTLKVE